MNENKNAAESVTPHPDAEHEVHPGNESTSETAAGKYPPIPYPDGNLYYDSMCLSCRHWDNYTCELEDVGCNRDPI